MEFIKLNSDFNCKLYCNSNCNLVVVRLEYLIENLEKQNRDLENRIEAIMLGHTQPTPEYTCNLSTLLEEHN